MKRTRVTPTKQDVVSNDVKQTSPSPVPSRSQARRFQQLQRAVGNQAVQRMIQAKGHGEIADMPSIVSEALNSDGQPLDATTRALMEARFEHNFSDVRVHTDARATEAARSIKAQAFTVGHNVVFGRGQYTPKTSEGAHLLAHELTHVIQQKQNGGSSDRMVSRSTDAAEREASGISAAVSSSEPSTTAPKTILAAPAAIIQRTGEGAGMTSPDAPMSIPVGATDQQSSSGSPPVLWGLNTKENRFYASVRAPGHTLIEIVTYIYKDAIGMLEPIRQANGGLPDFVPAGQNIRMLDGMQTDRAFQDIRDALKQGYILRSEGMATEEEQQQILYRFSAAGQSFELTEGQLNGMLQGLSVWITRKATYLRDIARIGRETQHEHVEGTSDIVRGISDLLAEQSVPNEIIWDVPENGAQKIINDLTTAQLSADLISRKTRQLQIVAESLDNANRTWHEYIEGTISGAETAVHALEVTRDVSFGIAIGIGAVVAAPVVATALGTGVLATGAIVTVGGGTAGAILRGGSNVAGQALANESIDWSEVGSEAQSGFVRGSIDAFTGVIAPGIGSGVSRAGSAVTTRVLGEEAAVSLATRMSSSAIGRFGLRAAAGVPSGSIVGGIHSGLTTAATGRVEDIPQAMGQGMLFGAASGLGGAVLEPLLNRIILPNRFSFRFRRSYEPVETTFHGTSPQNIANIRRTGPSIRGDVTDDFGPGFYAATDPATAQQIGGRFGRPTGVMPVPIPRRGAVLDLSQGDGAQAWNRFLDMEVGPGLTNRTIYNYNQQSRGVVFERFLRNQGLPNPDIVIGPIPNYPGAVQISIRNPQIIADINAMLQLPRGQLLSFLAMLGQGNAANTDR